MVQPGRDELLAWRDATSEGYWSGDGDLSGVLALYLDPATARRLSDAAAAFGRTVAEVIEPAVRVQEASRDYPRLVPYGPVGERREMVEFHPAHDVAATAAWASGMLATTLDVEGAFALATTFFLLAHAGEGGQACPIVCTVGLRRALEHHGDDALRDAYLAGLASSDATSARRGSQFLTEVQGGSDVGANVTRAVPDPDHPGAWRLFGEKWFCSVADADLFAVTARPTSAGPGTRGLGCFLVPRSREDGTPNGFAIRRLKDKLGTRLLASAEIDFDGALAWPISEVTGGFRVVVEELLNTSRWLNAVGSVGIMSRATAEAASFARHRTAFGSPIVDFPAVREQLAIMRVETAAGVASTFALTELVGKLDAGVATATEEKVHRFLVNANKFATSIAATDVVHRGIEVLGGNGTIEDFSALPRLYRDAIVFESWEGTHNVLCSQVRRDCARLGLLDALAEWLGAVLAQVRAPLGSMAAQVESSTDECLRALARDVRAPGETGVQFRHHLSALVRVVQAACLLRQAAATGADSTLVALFCERHLTGLGEEGPTWGRLVDAVAVTDAAPPVP